MKMHYDAIISTYFGAIAITTQATSLGEQLAIELLTSKIESSQIFNQTSTLVQRAYMQIQAYLEQPNTAFNIPFTPNGTAFQQRVWQAISQIPAGQTLSYGQLAHSIGSGPRAVANACGANCLPIIIPCHRVVAQNGLGGFMQSKANGLSVKKWLLQHEGITQYGS